MNNIKKYKIVFLDIDDTILDFKKCELNAITKTIERYGVTATKELTDKYSEINQSLWKAFERKEISKPELLRKRFDMFFKELDVLVDADEVNYNYLTYLSEETFLIDNAIFLLDSIYGKCKIYVITNAVERVQRSRLNKSGLLKYFDEVFISELIGYQKPDVRFFEEVYKQIGSPNKDEIIVLGDSLSSDIKGGVNFGVDTCYFNPHHKESEIKNYTYEIDNLSNFIKYIN